jgi:hypothetical protein
MNQGHEEQTLQIAATLLRPLVRLAVREGVQLGELSELMKRAYVEQAAEHLKNEQRRVTDAALSTLTGVHRKDVKRIGADAPLANFERPRKSLLSQVMELWSGDPRYITRHGEPRPLAKRSSGCAPGEESFEDLIQEVSKGVPPKALLDAWLEQGAVRLDEQGRVCRADPNRAADEQLHSFARSSGLAADRLDAAWANLKAAPGGELHFLHSVTGKGLLPADVEALTRLVRRWGLRFAGLLNRQVTFAEARGRKGGGSMRFSVGLNSYAEKVDEPAPQ